MALQLHPRVQITTQALQRRRATVARSTATRLLAPFICSKGPENEIVEIDNLSDFTEMFGGLSYTTPGQEQILNIGKWLAGGGIVCACRLTDAGLSDATAKKTEYSKTEKTLTINAVAKYSGKYYNDIRLLIDFNTNASFNISVLYQPANVSRASTIEKYNNLTIETIYKFINASQYIGSLEFDGVDTTERLREILGTDKTDSIEVSKKTDGADFNITDAKFIDLFKTVLPTVIQSRLTTPIDVFIDCGYSTDVKKILGKLFGATVDVTGMADVKRDDIFAIFTTKVLSAKTGKIAVGASWDYSTFSNNVFKLDEETYNIAVYDQYAKVVDNYSSLKSGNEVEVPMTYFLAELIPFNDAQYGLQYAPAGKQRTLIGSELLWISNNYTSTEKENCYTAGVNYVERDQDGYCFMTQLTFTQQDTTLKFINHERVLLKIKKDLEILGRNYLHEINDAITKKNLLNQLNSYLNNWIQNRTLRNLSSVAVYDATENETLENQELLIALDLVFNRTVEIISVEITCSE